MSSGSMLILMVGEPDMNRICASDRAVAMAS